MSPPSYPSRGRWRFRNVTRDFEFAPTLDSIEISQEHPDLTATLSCVVVDRDEGYAFVNEDEVHVLFAGDRIMAGHLKTVTESALEEFGPRTWTLDVQDFTGKLSDALVTRRRKRRKEKARRRIRWLLRYMTRRVWQLDGIDLSGVPDEVVEPYDYFGSTVEEGLQHVADQVRGIFYIDLDNVFRFFRDDAVPAPFDLDRANPDYVTTFPFREWSDTKDSVELATAVLMEPERRRDALWIKDTLAIATYGRQERFVSDSNIHRRKGALNTAVRAINDTKNPATEATLVVHEPGLWAGMKVHVTEDDWGADEQRYVKAVSIAALDPHDDEDQAYLVTTVTLLDRRRRRSHPHRSINKNTRRRPGVHANTKLHDVDLFRRVVAPPAWEPGDSMGAFSTYQASKGEAVDGSDIPFVVGPAALPVAASYIGAGYLPWTSEDCGCPGLENCFKGWRDIERWYKLTVPTHPADMAGATVTVSTPALDGVAAARGARVVVLDHEPTDTWQGGVVGMVGSTGGTVFIPGGLIPAAGGELHVGLQAGWRADYGTTACGWTWPFTSGDGESGRYRASIGSPTWQTYTDDGGDMGAIAVPGDAPWDGGNAWRDAGVEGSPTFGVDGSAYYVTAAAPAGRGLYVVGEREDDDEPWGPWSDVGWAVEVTFSVGVVGDSTAGPRSIEVRTTGEGEQAVGTVHLGDADRAPGISVGGPTAIDYEAVALTPDDRWRFVVDTRANRVRGKLWRVADGEPAAWNVQVDPEETEDDADRFTLWVRCGQDGGQTVRIHAIRARDAGHDGQRVDKEFLGHASGSTNRFQTCHPFRPGTLRVYVNGVGVGPAWEDGDDAAFRLDKRPTAGSILRASYTVDQGEGDD